MEFTFTCIYYKEGKKSIETNQHDLTYLKTQNLVVVRNEVNSTYALVPQKEFWYIYQNTPTPRFYHEVIFGDRPQRLKFDLDFLPTQVIDPCTLLKNFIQNLTLEFMTTYQQKLDPQTILVYDSSGETAHQTYKYSFHIVLSESVVQTNQESKSFTQRVVRRLDNYSKYIDLNVNKKIQNFRLYRSSKGYRIKKFNIELCTKLEVCVTESKYQVLIQFYPDFETTNIITKSIAEVEDDILHINNIVDDENINLLLIIPKIAKAAEHHRLIKILGGLLIFKRLSPSHCTLCCRVHDNDNTLLLLVTKEYVIERCRHSNSPGVILHKFDIPEGDQEKWLERAIENVKTKKYQTNKFDELPNKFIYNSELLPEFTLAPTIVIKSQMGTGKTKKLRIILEKYISENPEAIIIFLSFRQTFSIMIHSIFPDFKLYNKIKGAIDLTISPRLIIQVESLHRIFLPDSPEKVSVLILDEAESVLNQFNSSLHRNLSYSFAIFEWMIKTSKYCICMDANISNRTYNILDKLRPDHQITYHNNLFTKVIKDKYFITTKLRTWVFHLFSGIKIGQKVILAINSLSDAEKIYGFVCDQFPQKKVSIYTSKSTPSVKEHLRDVHKYWKVDVLIYTPTVSAGISFEAEHFDIVYGYFTDKSCDVETCRQMLSRVRNIKTQTYIIFIRAQKNNLPVKIEDISRFVHKSREVLYNLPVTIDNDTGEVVPYKTPYLTVWLENTRIKHLSHNNFLTRFLDQVASVGCELADLTSITEDIVDIDFIHNLYTISLNRVSSEKCRALASAPDINYEDYYLINSKISTNDPSITVQDLLIVEKYNLRQVYEWFDYEITPEFVENFYGQDIKYIFNNLKKILSRKTLYESLKQIRDEEKARHDTNIILENLPYDINYTYQFHELFNGAALLALCGFNDVLDTKIITPDLMDRFINENQDKINKILHHFVVTKRVYTIAKNKPIRSIDSLTKSVLSKVNSVIKKLWGREIKKVEQGFQLRETKLGVKIKLKPWKNFTINNEAPDAPTIYTLRLS
nr:Ribonucleoside-diphosphate reductase large subunit [Abalone asfa-like virus]